MSTRNLRERGLLLQRRVTLAVVAVSAVLAGVFAGIAAATGHGTKRRRQLQSSGTSQQQQQSDDSFDGLRLDLAARAGAVADLAAARRLLGRVVSRSAALRALGTSAVVVVAEPGALPAARRGAAARARRDRPRLQPLPRRLRARRASTPPPARPCASSPLLLEASRSRCARPRTTGGLVDPTVGRALRLAGYDRDFALVRGATATRSVPRVRAVPGLARGRARPRAPRRSASRRASSSTSARPPRRSPPTAPRAAAAARAGTGVLVSLGGDVAVAGPGSGGRLAGQRSPTTTPRRSTRPGRRSSIRSGGLATSGTAVRRWRARRRRAAPHRRPAHRPPGRDALAHGHGRGRLLRRRERREHRRDRARRGRARLARGARPARRASSRRDGGRRLAGGWPARTRLVIARRHRPAARSGTSTRGTGVVVAAAPDRLDRASASLDVSRWRCARWPRFVDRRPAPEPDAARARVPRRPRRHDGRRRLRADRLVDAVVPFVSAYRPFWLGLGALAFDLLLALIVTSLLRRRIGYRAGRRRTGSPTRAGRSPSSTGSARARDARAGWMLVLTLGCVGLVLVAVLWRVLGGLEGDWSGRRLAGALGVLALPLALFAWMQTGPLKRGWAARAGTPAALLGSSSGATRSERDQLDARFRSASTPGSRARSRSRRSATRATSRSRSTAR